MTGQSGSAGSRPAGKSNLNWNWLSVRVGRDSKAQLEAWLDAELATLERHFCDFVTAESERLADSRAQQSRASGR